MVFASRVALVCCAGVQQCRVDQWLQGWQLEQGQACTGLNVQRCISAAGTFRRDRNGIAESRCVIDERYDDHALVV